MKTVIAFTLVAATAAGFIACSSSPSSSSSTSSAKSPGSCGGTGSWNIIGGGNECSGELKCDDEVATRVDCSSPDGGVAQTCTCFIEGNEGNTFDAEDTCTTAAYKGEFEVVEARFEAACGVKK